MTNKTANEHEAKSGKSLKPESDRARYHMRRRLAGVLLCLLGLSATVRSARAETIVTTNSIPITTPDVGVAGYYPSTTAALGDYRGKITAVRVTLHNITHTFPDDYDIMLVGPGGQRVILMSDCGGSHDLNNVTITFSDAGPPLPDEAQITSGTYHPGNHDSTGNNPLDTFSPDPAQAYSTQLAVFNNTSANGIWKLYVVDDAAGDSGSIDGGWTLELDTTGFTNYDPIVIPSVGTATPYPSQINVAGLLGHITNVHVKLLDMHHTFPDDLDILLVGPQGQETILMSDCGSNANLDGVDLIFDDLFAPLPDNSQLTSGSYHPSNYPIGMNDTFPPDPPQVYLAALDVFKNTAPNGAWSLKVVDDAAGDSGDIQNGWTLDFDLEPPILANISTRLNVGTGDNALIGGFIVTGTQPKKVIVRALGPSVPLPGPGQLADPTLELRDGSGALIWFNDDWHNGAPGFPSQEAEIIATTIPPTNNLEAAIVVTLPANNSNYTAIVRGLNNGTGVGLVEVYDLDHTVDSKLANISTRGLVQTGDNVMIAGTIVLGGFSQRVLVRAIGPSLPLAGKLADPTLELRDSNGGLIASNDDWQDSQDADVLATTIPPTNNLESAIVATLPAGGASYTAIVRGVNGTTGVAVVEVYALQ